MRLCPSPVVGGGAVDSQAANSATRLRSYLAVGLVLAGATLVAVAPAMPALPGMQERAVQLASTTDWETVFTDAFQNVQQIGQEIAADPSPVLTQIMENQATYGQTIDTALQDVATGLDGLLTQGLPAALQQAMSELQSGDVTDAVQTVFGTLIQGLLFDVSIPLQPVLEIPSEMTQNLTNVLAQLPTITADILGGVIGPFYSEASAFGDTAQEYLDAISAGDQSAALAILQNAPATLTGAFLNGYALDNGEGIFVGLLSSMSAPSGPGPLDDLLVGIPQMIAQLLGESAASSAI